MGGLLHLFEFNHTGTSRKLLTHKRHADGLEAPRNSLELPVDTLSHQVMQDNLPYSYQVKHHSEKSFIPSGTPMKKLIDDEMFKPTATKRSGPSVVAHLMGMDSLPEDVKKPMAHVTERGNESASSSFRLKHVRETKHQLHSRSSVQDPEQLFNGVKLVKPQPREHPQEEELQKFKKEFEEWQASKFWERSRSVELGSNSRSWRDGQVLAQENLNREKMTHCVNASGYPFCEKPLEIVDHSYTLPSYNTGEERVDDLLYFHPSQNEALNFRNKTDSNGGYQRISQKSCKVKGTAALPTKIVILKPALERSSDTDDSWPSTSEIVDEDGCIEDFLEEVKERLRFEIQSNIRKNTSIRSGGSDTPLHERAADAKEIARHIAKHVRQSVTRDLGMSLLRSESTRSCRNEVQFNGPDSSEFINKDTRKFLSEQLRNVLRKEIDVNIPSITDQSSKAPVLEDDTSQIRPSNYTSSSVKKAGHWEQVKGISRTKPASFGHEEMNDMFFDGRNVSPRNLMRSLSAPVSRTSFGKLLLEEPRILTGAHIRRKHESTDIVSVEVKKTRKERFSFRGKVSNLRHSFTLRGKLFGKKVQSVEKLRSNLSDATVAFPTVPSVLMNIGIAQENSTEVPPSPASVCSSAYDELLRPGGHPNSVFTLDIPCIEDHPLPLIFKDINSDIHELRRQLNMLHSRGCKDAIVEEDPVEPEMITIEHEEVAYIREILVASGLYDGSSLPNHSIDMRVFEEVEERYKRSEKDSGEAVKDASKGGKVGRKVLFDLLNEALSTVVGKSTVNRPRLRNRTIYAAAAVPCGKRLLNDIWRRMHVYVYPPADGGYTVDDIVINDLTTTLWAALMDDKIESIGKEVERMILGELIDEATKDLCC